MKSPNLSDAPAERESLTESKEGYRVVAESASDVIVTVDEGGKILFVNPAAEKVIGYKPAELIGKNLSIIIPERFRAAHAAGMRRYLSTGERRIPWSSVELPAVRSDGQEIEVEISFGESREGGRRTFTAVMRDITERKRIQSQLRASEERYRFLSEAVPQQVWTANADGELDYGNRRTVEYFGQQAGDELLGSDWLVILHPEDLERTIERWTRSVETGEQYEIEFRLRRADGEYRWHLAQAVPMRDADGTILKWFGTNTDIHDRRLADERLRKSEEYLNLFRHANDAILIFDPKDETVLDANDRACEIYGFRREEFLGKSIKEISKEVARGEKQLAELLRRGAYEEFETVQFRADGSPIHFLINSSVIEFEGKPAVLSINRDITERKKLELVQRESEQRFHGAFNDAPIGMALVAPDGKWLQVNRSLCEIVGYAEAELLSIDFQTITHPDDLDADLDLAGRILAGEIQTYQMEKRYLHKQGRTVWVMLSVSLVRDEKGEPLYFIAQIQDVTERKRAERETSRLAAIVESSSDAIISKDPDGVIKTWNAGAEKLFGYNSGEAVGQHISLLFPTERLAEETAIIESILAGQTIEQFETVRVRKDGSQVPVSVTVSPIRNAAGEIVGISKIGRDITERKRTEAELQQNYSLLNSTLEATADGILAVDAAGRIILANQKFAEMWKLSEDDLQKFDFGLPPEPVVNQLKNPQHFVENIKRIDLDQERDSFDVLEFKDGRFYERHSKPQRLNGEIVGRVFSFSDVTERKRAENQLLHNALHDALTGLPNRALFLEHLRHAIERVSGGKRRAKSFAVLFLDLDHFKVINDSLGHMEGDRLLRLVAARLAHSLRAGDIVARLGGDEFTVLLDDLDAPDDARQIVERIHHDLKTPFDLSGREVSVTASIGIALCDEKYCQPEEMLRDADIAMYRAKAAGKARHQTFNSAMHEQASRRLQLEIELRRAVENEEFSVYYQPIVDLQAGGIVAFESLVRWNHRTRGIVSPAEFIPLAEETGLILPLGLWIFRESCRQLREWQRRFPSAAGLGISVNLSSKQFAQPDLVEQVAGVLRETELAPGCLKLEVTESHVMETGEAAETMMRELQALGVELSLDDFGTGYSSLSYLHRLPAKYLKVDRSFVSRMSESEENYEIVRTIINLAQNLKMRVVAEGIETAEQMRHLQNLGCDCGQGYLFSEPLATEAVTALLLDAANILPRPPTGGSTAGLSGSFVSSR